MIEDSKKSEATQVAYKQIRDELDERIHMKLDNAVNTESNLSSEVLRNILKGLGINLEPYESKFHMIDESLVSRRNQIAHGEYLDIGLSDWRTLADDVLALIKTFKHDIENQASQEGYRAKI